MSLGKIISSFSNTVGTFEGFLSEGRTNPYPFYPGKTNRIIPGNWKLSLPYSFRVEGVSSQSKGGKSPLSGLYNVIGSPSGGGMFDEFFLPIAPQQLTQEEVFSINITPTQRGMVIEHNGVVFKELVISGNTGQRVNNDLTGYEAFHQLRNYLRAYAELKKSPNQAYAQLIFVNRKDNESLIVEPIKFSMERNKDGPFLYSYRMSFKVIGEKTSPESNGILGNYFNNIDSIINDATDLIYGARNTIQRSIDFIKTFEREIVSTIVEPIEALGLLLKSIKGLPLTLADMPSNIFSQLSSRTVGAFLDQAKTNKANGDPTLRETDLPKNTNTEAKFNTANALNILPLDAKATMSLSVLEPKETFLLNQSINSTKNTPRIYYESLLAETKSIRDVASQKFGLSNDFYNDLVGITDPLSSSEIDDPEDLTLEKIEILKAFFDIQSALTLLLSTNYLFKEDVSEYILDVESKYDNKIDILSASSVDEIVLADNTTLEQIAMEYLGDATRWIDIVVLNDLIYPYIDEASTNSRIKAPGQKILIPRQAQPTASNIPITKPNRLISTLSETERNLGVDLKLSLNDLTFDFRLGNNNDFELIYGGANAAQAIITKISMEKGSLKYHPEIGVGLSIGEKIRQGVDIRDDLINSILSDPRFTNIKDLSFETSGNTIRIKMNLVVKYLQTPIPVIFDT